jgi:hypothetical protein
MLRVKQAFKSLFTTVVENRCPCVRSKVTNHDSMRLVRGGTAMMERFDGELQKEKAVILVML